MYFTSNRKANAFWQKADYIKEMEIIFAFFFPLKMLMNALYYHILCKRTTSEIKHICQLTKWKIFSVYLVVTELHKEELHVITCGEPLSAQWSISFYTPENTRKPKVFKWYKVGIFARNGLTYKFSYCSMTMSWWKKLPRS